MLTKVGRRGTKMKNRLTKKEMYDYLDAVSKEIFDKEYKSLSDKQKNTIKMNLSIRMKNGEIDKETLEVLLDRICSEMKNYIMKTQNKNKYNSNENGFIAKKRRRYRYRNF